MLCYAAFSQRETGIIFKTPTALQKIILRSLKLILFFNYFIIGHKEKLFKYLLYNILNSLNYYY